MSHTSKTDLSRLRAALEGVFSASARAAVRSLIDIGCGRCDECDLLLNLFPSAALTLLEIDHTHGDILRQHQASNPDRIRLHLDDARALHDFAPGPHDLAIIRHPDIQNTPGAWARIITTTIDQLISGGHLLLTLYTTAEAEAARRVTSGAHVREIPQQNMGGSPVALAGNDRYIMIIEKL